MEADDAELGVLARLDEELRRLRLVDEVRVEDVELVALCVFVVLEVVVYGGGSVDAGWAGHGPFIKWPSASY